jgi:HD superfamily phosphodiesterase
METAGGRRERSTSQEGELARHVNVPRAREGTVTYPKETSMHPLSSTTDVVAGVYVPDTKVVAEATELVRDTTSELVYQHSRRVFFFGSLQGRNRDLSFDPELLYIAAMFHDLGLNQQFHGSGRRFEDDSAAEARRFLLARGVPEDSVRRVWTAIALHTTPGIPELMEPEVALVAAGVDYDVLGIGYYDIEDDLRAEITALHPRPHFKREILQAFTDGMVDRPETTFGTVNADVLDRFVPGFQRGDFVDTIENSPWPE